MKKFFKILLVILLMIACFAIGGITSKSYWEHEINVDRYWEGYRAAEEKYKETATLKQNQHNTATPVINKELSTTKEPKENKAITKTNSDTITVKAGNKSYKIRQTVKDELDAYEAYWDEYIATLKSLKNSDAVAYLTKYSEMIQKLEEIDKYSSKIKDMTDDEDSYFGYRILEISQKMLQAIQGTL